MHNIIISDHLIKQSKAGMFTLPIGVNLPDDVT